jgi:hypothetical protein
MTEEGRGLASLRMTEEADSLRSKSLKGLTMTETG